ncbi:hypothetical protein CCR85_00590 [Rhodothalassium salexigens]|uniref:Mur ligase family protein n=1 Tax=Rhodothalassium salexigens TaxID=1086 RepID=UPI001911B53F|nr:UDP-N-acetylmuramoyl-tripeptide--D-alanyl-D-alanine ligase [Rhodothalassium salexigens]MBK5909991.1 hypothetical protein [Rhodothalassium salexigens]MBK5921601.1 hypothetical protein [Rhodothalassium salexigens]
MNGFPLDGLLIALVSGAAAVFALARLKAYLMFFQQEEYDAPRFRHWLVEAGARDHWASLAAVGAVALTLMVGQQPAFDPGLRGAAVALLIGGLGLGALASQRLLDRSKKPLVMTERARRLYWLALALAVALWALGLAAGWPLDGGTGALGTLAVAQAAPYLLVLANLVLKPFETRVKARYRAEAVDKLARLDPQVIAITGSYGKTSTKQILHHILSAAAPTLATPGSVNTEMGITRVIREQLTPEHQYFIVEMGAYGPGSIARLCRLTPPKLSLVTAVGWAHYERFKSVDAVFQAKFEIAEAAAAQGGVTILNRDMIPARLLDPRLAQGAETYIQTGTEAQMAYRLVRTAVTADGLTLDVTEAETGETTTLSVPVWGRHQAGNVVVAVAAARRLGLPMATIKAALATLPQVRHRLEVFKRADGPTIVDDAYNSNPAGFAAGLEALGVLTGPGGRRILVTPGMVEMGARHDDAHAELGRLAADSVDVACVVTPQRIPTFVEPLAAAPGVEVHRFERQSDAEDWVKTHAHAGDAVLFENNLPDLYEARPRF